MARITVEDCLTKQTNRFGLVLLAAKRAKQLLTGSRQVIKDNRGNKAVVTALREIADGRVRFMSPEEIVERDEREAADRAKRTESQSPAAPAAAPVVAEVPAGEEENRNGDSSTVAGL